MIKQVINGLVADERALWAKFGDNVGPTDRVFRTKDGYVIIDEHGDAPENAEAIGPVSEWYDAEAI